MANVSHLWVPVSNLEHAIEFYTKKLKLVPGIILKKQGTKDSNDDIPVKENFAELVTEDGAVTFYLIEKPEVLPARGGAVIGFEVDDLEAMKTAYEKEGISIVGDIITVGDRKMLNFRDKDRYIFQLSEKKKN